MVLDKGTCLRYYKRKDVQEALVEHSQDKEISFQYGQGFGKRPDILVYPRDVIELARRNVTSFHSSEEIWEDPLALSSELKRKELDELRSGWDLVLDIDCKFIEYSKISAALIIKFLEYQGVKDISLKFSGNKGFHIGVPFQAFPEKVGTNFTKDLFPEAPRKIALYIKENIKEELSRKILELEDNDFNKIKEKVELKGEDIVRYEKNSFGDKVAKLNVDKFLEIDTILLASRHLYRMPYSLHEKLGLVSLPINTNQILEFERDWAKPEKIVPKIKFLSRDVQGESAKRLLISALDFEAKVVEEKKFTEDKKERFEREEFKVENPIKEDFFPPCIKKILLGLEDGKKRAVFILSNFLGKIGWSNKEIETYILRWNKEKNKDPLRENYIMGQLRYFKAGDKLPPNCSNEGYYKGLGMCLPDHGCKRIKNPANYTIIRWKIHLENKEQEEKEEARLMRKEEREKKKLEKELKKAAEIKEENKE